MIKEGTEASCPLTQLGATILCNFGVELTRTFETAGEV